MHRAAATWGYPETFLTDNGAIFTASARGGLAAMQTELLSLGIASKHSRPYHPQTCGKVERFHQTLKRYLAKQEPADHQEAAPTPARPLRRRLQPRPAPPRPQPTDPRRSLRRPREGPPPRTRRSTPSATASATTRSTRRGAVTLRYRGRLHHIGVGAAFKGWRVILLVAGRDIRILSTDGTQLRRLTLNPQNDYQPIG